MQAANIDTTGEPQAQQPAFPQGSVTTLLKQDGQK